MIRSYVSEWIRFRKTGRVGILVTVGFVALASLFLFIGGDSFGGEGGEDGAMAGGIDLTAADGAVAALSTAINMIGIMSLALFALSVARDFELGTIRNLLVGQPKRLTLLTGKLLAVGSYIIIAVVAAGLVSALLATALAPGQDIPTEGWTAVASIETIGTVTIATLLYGLVGAMLAMLTRSSAASITIGVAYLIVVENLVGIVWDNASQWLPAGAFSAVAAGGTSAVSFDKATTLSLGYAVVGLVVMYVTLARRDITD